MAAYYSHFVVFINARNHSNSNKNENVSGDPVIRREQSPRQKLTERDEEPRDKECVKKKANTNVEGEIEIIIKMYVYLLSTFLQ